MVKRTGPRLSARKYQGSYSPKLPNCHLSLSLISLSCPPQTWVSCANEGTICQGLQGRPFQVLLGGPAAGTPPQCCRVPSRRERDECDSVFILEISQAVCQPLDHKTNTSHKLRSTFHGLCWSHETRPFTAWFPPLTLSLSAVWEGELPEGMNGKCSPLASRADEPVWVLRVATGATQGLLLGRDNNRGRVGWQKPSQKQAFT